MEHDTLLAYLDQWAEEKSDEIWLRDFKGEGSDDYSWGERVGARFMRLHQR